jgi:methyl-accepting chemotaxis protein
VNRKQVSLERKMLSYFGLIAAASLLITLEFVWAIHKATPVSGTGAALLPSAAASGLSVVAALQSLKNKALLMFVVQAVVTLTVLIMFMRRITGPLQHMVEVASAISEGDLSRAIQVRTPDEIGLVGEMINGLTTNIQELVALGLSTESSLRAPIDSLRRLHPAPEAGRCLDEIQTRLTDFRDMMETFKLFPAPPAASDAKGDLGS